MTWRYQPILSGEFLAIHSMITVEVDEKGRLESWSEEYAICTGNTHPKLYRDLKRMLADCRTWRPVKYDQLVVGMKFRRKQWGKTAL